jgi:hypothetical protein
MTDFRLSEHDKSTGLWLRLRDHLTERLSAARVRNDMLLPENDTAMLRGEIKTLKRILSLGEDRPVLTGDGEDAP